MAVLRHLNSTQMVCLSVGFAFASHDASTGGGISTESNLQASNACLMRNRPTTVSFSQPCSHSSRQEEEHDTNMTPSVG